MKKIKFYLIAAIMLLCSGVNAQQGTVGIPISDFGYKGNIIAVSNPHFVLNENMEVTATDVMGFSMYLTEKTKNGYKAEGSGYNYTITTSKGKITKISFKGNGSEDWSGSMSFTYNKDKIVMNGTQSRTYTETYYVDYTSKAQELYNQAEALNRKFLNGSISYSAYYNKYMNLINQAEKYTRIGYETKTRKKKETDKLSVTFSNFKYDRFGNLVSFDMKSNASDYVRNEVINITYDQDWYGQEVFAAAKSIEDYEALYNDALSSNAYRTEAMVMYNNLILATLEKEYENNTNAILEVMSKEILSRDNYNKLSQIISERFYGEALAIRNFKAVAEEANKSLNINGVEISKYNSEYKKMIKERSAQLRSDSLEFLRNKAKKELTDGMLTDAIETTNGLFVIEPNDAVAIDIAQDAYYNLIMNGVNAGKTDIELVDHFQTLYPDNKYNNTVEDIRATYYYDNLSAKAETRKMISLEEVEFLRSLPTNDEKLTRNIKKFTRKQEFKNKRGDVWNFALGINGEFGSGMYGYFGEVGIRLGYLKNWVNGYIGARFGGMGSTSGLFSSKEENATSGSSTAMAPDGKLDMIRISIPLTLRLNLYSTYTSAFYLGLGADLNVNLKTQIKTSEDKISDNKMANTITYSPRISLGYNANNLLEFEVFGLYDLKNTFNTEYMQSEGLSDLMDPEIYKEQTENKMRFGAALRILF